MPPLAQLGLAPQTRRCDIFLLPGASKRRGWKLAYVEGSAAMCGTRDFLVVPLGKTIIPTRGLSRAARVHSIHSFDDRRPLAGVCDRWHGRLEPANALAADCASWPYWRMEHFASRRFWAAYDAL